MKPITNIAWYHRVVVGKHIMLRYSGLHANMFYTLSKPIVASSLRWVPFVPYALECKIAQSGIYLYYKC